MKVNRFKKVALAFVMLALTVNCLTGYRAVSSDARSKMLVGDSADFVKLREAITKRILGFEPEELRMLGDSTAAGRLKDWSPEAVKEEVEFCRSALRQLAAARISDPAERLDREVLTAHLTYLEYYYGHYHGELGNLQISAYPYEVIQYELQRLAIGQADAASAGEHFGAVEAILRGLPRYLKQQESNLMAGLKLHPPDKIILGCMIKRIRSASRDDDLQTTFCPPDTSGKDESIRGGLNDLERRLASAEFQQQLPAPRREVLRDLLQRAGAAYDRHADFLRSKLLPQARDSWPLGRDEYQRRFALIYGDRTSLDELVREAEAELGRINEEMNSLAHELRPNFSLGETLEEMWKQHPGTEREALNTYEQVQKRIDDGLTSKLGLPVGAARYVPAPLGVPVDPATNWPAPLLSKGLGIVLVNTSPNGLEENDFVDMPWVAAHEGNPGHAAQSLLFQRAFNEGRAPLCRFLNVPDEVGYVRGNWYAMATSRGGHFTPNACCWPPGCSRAKRGWRR